MSDAWMPGVKYVRSAADGGALKGGAPRVVWEAIGADPRAVSARSAAQRLDQGGRPSHLVWNPLNGETVQLIPIVRAARALSPAPGSAGPPNWPGRTASAEVNNEGRVCVQICVVASIQDPFTDLALPGLPEILNWLDSWGVPRRWPAGPPASFPACLAAARSRQLWARGGHFGASQVPGLTAAGPGAIDVERLTGWPARPVGPGNPRPGLPQPGAARLGAAQRGLAQRGDVQAWPDRARPGGYDDYEDASFGEFRGSRVVLSRAR